MSMKKAFWLLVLVVLLLAFAGFRVVPRVIVANESGQTIEWLQVEVAGETLDFGEVPTGEQKAKSLRITRDSRFMVSFNFAGGAKARVPVGHIQSPAWWSRTRIIVETQGSLDIQYD